MLWQVLLWDHRFIDMITNHNVTEEPELNRNKSDPVVKFFQHVCFGLSGKNSLKM